MWGSSVSGIPSSACVITSTPSGARSRRNSRSLPALLEARTRREIMIEDATPSAALACLRCATGSGPQRLLLRCDQFADPALGEADQHVHLAAEESRAFGGALQLDEAAGARHHDVHVGIARGILALVQVDHPHPLDNPYPHRPHLLRQP